MATYPTRLNDLITEIRDWSNRDDAMVLNDATIKRCLEYAADTAYRALRIPPLERTANYTIAESDKQDVEGIPGVYVTLAIPSDLVSFISLRVQDKGVVFNEKVDERTFFDRYADKSSYNRFARLGTRLHVTGDFDTGDVLELRYYRRLAALDARYSVNATNVAQAATFLHSTDDAGNPLSATATTVDGQEVTPTVWAPTGQFYVGKVVPNWLRDENRKCLVFGALYHAFDFLADPMAERWRAKFDEAIAELNAEEKMRKASGGNVSINFSSNLI